MRAAFARTLSELATRDGRILLLTADLGFMALEPFSDPHPKRFFNVGVAEQNMVGVATGLAEAGFIPFLYSIVTFASLRPYEFIRNGPVAHHLPVRIVAVGGGFEYGTAGPTHHGLEDVGVMRMLPGLTVVAPADHEQARSALLATWDLPGPVYYRLGKDDRTTVPGLGGRFKLGHVDTLGDGADLLFLVMGAIAADVVVAATQLTARGVSCSVAVVSTLNPTPEADLSRLLGRFPVAITVEAHHASGGLGSMVAEVIADNGLDCRMIRAGVREANHGLSGSTGYFHRLHGLDPDSLVRLAVGAVRVKAE